MTPEAKVKKNIDRILKPYVDSGDLVYNKTAGSMYGKNGWPDYSGVLVGEAFFVEAKATPAGKTQPGKVSALQAARIAQIERAGGTVLIIHENNMCELNDYLRATVAPYENAIWRNV